MSLQKIGLDWAERGILPDSVIRYGIRRLCRERLRQEHEGGCEREQQAFREHLEAARRGPIAPVPELANEQHYEVPAAFYDRSLGARKKYSCCYWDDSTPNLDAAEERALAITCERAQLEDGDRILELGCGWGSLTLWMAEHYPSSQITAVSNSASQREFIESELARRGFDHVTIITRDVNELELDAEFDRVVSVEMFEHVRDHGPLLERISHWLRPGGTLFVHVFCHRQVTYAFEPDADSWMAQLFFSGGIMPSDSYLLRFQDHLRVKDQWRWSGQHYEKTANAWLENLDAHRAEVRETFVPVYGEENADRWIERWRIFFMACAELWGYRNGNEWWVSHYLFENPAVPEERANTHGTFETAGSWSPH